MNGYDTLLQMGGLGMAAYSLYWLTRRLNGKVDNLAVHLRENTDAIRGLTSAVERRYGPSSRIDG